MQAQDIITNALLLGGLIGSGETPSSTESTDALFALNDLIDIWQTEKLLLPVQQLIQFPLVSGQGVYWLGTDAGGEVIQGQTIAASVTTTGGAHPARPAQSLRRAGYFDSSAGVQTVTNLIIVPESEMLTLSAVPATGNPQYATLQNFYPNSALLLYPTPTSSTLVLNCNVDQQIPPFASLTQSVYLPPGYSRALRYNLAVELGEQYGKPASPNVVAIAQESKAVLKQNNTTPVRLKSELVKLRQSGALESR